MKRDELLLDIHTLAHLQGTSHENPDRALIDLLEKYELLHVCIGIVDKGNLLFRYPALDELCLYIVINIEFRGVRS